MCPEANHAAWQSGQQPVLESRSIVEAGYSGDVTLLSAALDSDDPRHRQLAASGLARLGLLDGPTLGRLLADGDPAVRRTAAELWATIDLPEGTLPSLAQVLADPDDTVTEVACFAAGERGDAPPAIVDALSQIATGHPDHLCRESAVAALGAIGNERGLGAVLTACEDRATVRRRAVLALAAFEGPRVDAMLERLLGDRDLQVRQGAEDLLSIPPDGD
jgi:hypothetical protein